MPRYVAVSVPYLHLMHIDDWQHFNVMWEHCLQAEKFGPDGMYIRSEKDIVRDLPPPKRSVSTLLLVPDWYTF
jgi:hypothetical protein